MQKRTNPLALRGDAKPESDLLREKEIELDSPVPSQKKVTERAQKPEKTASSAPRTDKTQETPRRPGDFRTAKSVTTDTGATITYAATPGGVVATRVEPAMPDPEDDWMNDVAVEEPEILEDEMIEDDGLVLEEEQQETALESTPAPSEVIEDEQAFPTLQDFELAARFSLRGKNSRKLILGKVSRDVLRLAQLLHPDEKISTIVENALLTRIFLENPEAFDAMASVIEENGGRIKC